MSYLVRAHSRRDRLGTRWDSRLESSSDKTLSRPSPPLPSRSAYCRRRTTESRGVVGPAGTQMSIVDWEPSGLHPTFASRRTASDRPQILAHDRFHHSARFLLGREHGRNVGGVGVGWDVSEEVGRVRKYAIFIAEAACGLTIVQVAAQVHIQICYKAIQRCRA
jgi:hypothetical protein